MTTVVVDGAGYAAAVEHLRAADRAAATHALGLARDLQDCGAMIGNPSLAGPLATAYDRAAATTLDAHATLTRALTGLGTATAASLYNHTRAELASAIGQVHHLDDPGDATGADPHGWDEVDPPAALPTSSGGTTLDLPGWAREVLDLVQGFVWPDADLTALRSTAATWNRAGDQVRDTGIRVLAAARALHVERSPEIPLAQDALRRLDVRLHLMAADHHQVAAVCRQYADLVEHHRTAILDLVQEVRDRAAALRAAALDPGLSGVLLPPLHAYRVGEAAIDGLGAVTDAAPRFLALLDQLRAAAADLAHALDTVTTRVDAHDRGLYFTDPRTLPGPYAPDSWLRRHEGGAANGHTIRKHVGKTDRQLRRRFLSELRLQFSSTYPDEKTASSAIRAALARNDGRVQSWLRSGKPNMSPIHYAAPPGIVVGRVMARGSSAKPTNRLRVVLQRDESMPDKYRVITSFPEL